jgi:putative copper export protein
MKIKVRNSIRVLGLLLSLFGFIVIFLMIFDYENLSSYEFFLLMAGGLFFFPLVLSSSIFGRVPYFISKRIPKMFEDTTLNAEKNFKEFSVESVVGAIVFLTIVFLTIYFQ